jgi:hypothetical protein
LSSVTAGLSVAGFRHEPGEHEPARNLCPIGALVLAGHLFHDQRPSGRFFFGLVTAAGLEPATLSFEG